MATRAELVRAVGERYKGEQRREKTQILDEFVAVTGYHRKHALRLLNDEREPEGAAARSGHRVYGEAVRAALLLIWETADRICGKRLKAALPTLVEAMERHGHLSLDEEVRRRVLSVSAATIDRLLQPVRQQAGQRKRRPGPSTAVQRKVPVRTFGDWKDPVPGYFEADLVAHCGGSMSGSFVHSFVLTDIVSGWTEGLPLLVREQGLVVETLDAFRTKLPMALLGLDTDNDSVFMNDTVLEYCLRDGIELTRSRAYRRNDQAWVEQKNGAVVRRLVGYGRLQGIESARLLARLFEAARLYVNFFQPSFKLREKLRDGARVTKRYFPPATPYERLLAHPEVSSTLKERLREEHAALDPVALLKDIREAQAQVARLAPRNGDPPETYETNGLKDFLAQLPELWRQGEARPTHRRPPRSPRTWRTRVDPFETVWPEVREWLEAEPDITGKALFGRLRKKHPGEFAPGQLRTLQRRVRQWRRALAAQLLAVSTGERTEDARLSQS